jgi:predicted PolB exonuclease-like 3'-5' exonuclease
MGLPGKPAGVQGKDVDRYYREGRIQEIADYCEGDVVNAYQNGCDTSCFAES